MSKLKIATSGIHPLSAKIHIDGKEIKGVRKINVNLDIEETNTAIIELIPSEIEIDGDFIIKEANNEE